MSHFSTLVVTDDKPMQAQLQQVLLPWHEYECTGLKAYCVWVDETDEVMKDWAETQEMVRCPDGKILHTWDDVCYRPPTAEEAAKIGTMGGMGVCNGIVYASKKWDGIHYETRVQYVPEGYELCQVTRQSVYKTLKRFAEDYHGYRPIPGKPGRYGRFTNPNARWDWWQVGGRYRGRLRQVGSSVELDQVRRDALDVEAMRREAILQRLQWVQECCVKAGLPVEDLDEALKLDHALSKVWQELPEPKPRGAEYRAWLASQPGPVAPKLAVFKEKNWELPPVPHNHTVDQWVQAAPALTSFAVVMDDQWFERGKMGWWATVSDEKDGWEEHFNSLLALVKPTQWLTVVDCHI